MSYSGKTEHFDFPQYVAGKHDHPDFLTDFNNFFSNLDNILSIQEKEINLLKAQIKALEEKEN